MNTLVIVLIAAVCLLAGYALYGRWLAKKWGIDPTAETPAVKHNDGEDMYRPTDGPYLHISFLLSPEPVPSPVPFRQQHSDGFQYFSGSC